MTIEFNEIPKDHPSYRPAKRLFRFHSNLTVMESVANAIEVTDLHSLKVIVRARGFSFKELTVKPYAYDDRIDWLTYIVCADGRAIGYTNHSLALPELNPNIYQELKIVSIGSIDPSIYSDFLTSVKAYQSSNRLPLQMSFGEPRLSKDGLTVNYNLLLTDLTQSKWVLVDVIMDHIDHPTMIDGEGNVVGGKIHQLNYHTSKAVSDMANKTLKDLWGY